jgi:hypothetical protein
MARSRWREDRGRRVGPLDGEREAKPLAAFRSIEGLARRADQRSIAAGVARSRWREERGRRSGPLAVRRSRWPPPDRGPLDGGHWRGASAAGSRIESMRPDARSPGARRGAWPADPRIVGAGEGRAGRRARVGARIEVEGMGEGSSRVVEARFAGVARRRLGPSMVWRWCGSLAARAEDVAQRPQWRGD